MLARQSESETHGDCIVAPGRICSTPGGLYAESVLGYAVDHVSLMATNIFVLLLE